MKILYIEDSQGDFRRVQIQLEECKNNYELIHAKNLKDGLRILRNQSISLTLLDLNLPDSRGIQTIDRIVKYDPFINFTVLTGSDDKSIGLNAIDKGAQDFLIKDDICNSPKLLEASITYSMAQHRTLQAYYERRIEYQNQQEKYHYAFDDNLYPILIINIAKRKLVDANCAACDLLGYSEKDIIPNEVKNIFHSENDLDSIIENINYKGELLSKSINIKGRNDKLIDAKVSVRLTCIKKNFCTHITIIHHVTSTEFNYALMKEIVIKFLAADKLKKAVGYLIENLREINLQKELVSLSARLVALDKDSMKGTVSHDKIKIERNNIRYSLVDIVGSLPNQI